MRARVPVPNPHAVRASGDRWLFGYADIVTLLLAVFAAMYAAGAATPAALAPAPAPAPPPVAASEVPPAAPAASPMAIVDSVDAEDETHQDLLQAFDGVVNEGAPLPGIEMMTSIRGLVISLPEAGSFPAGRADLSVSAMAVMADLAGRLRELPNQVRVEGHTDDVPIATPQFTSNWDLSTARATRVVEFLMDEGLHPARLAAAGYAEYRPRLPNDTPGARARNRRVDIVVLDPVTAAREDPGAMVP